MHESEDYQAKKPIVEKKMRRMQALKQECAKIEEGKVKLDEKEGRVMQISDEELEKIESLEELQNIINSNE